MNLASLIFTSFSMLTKGESLSLILTLQPAMNFLLLDFAFQNAIDFYRIPNFNHPHPSTITS